MAVRRVNINLDPNKLITQEIESVFVREPRLFRTIAFEHAGPRQRSSSYSYEL